MSKSAIPADDRFAIGNLIARARAGDAGSAGQTWLVGFPIQAPPAAPTSGAADPPFVLCELDEPSCWTLTGASVRVPFCSAQGLGFIKPDGMPEHLLMVGTRPGADEDELGEFVRFASDAGAALRADPPHRLRVGGNISADMLWAGFLLFSDQLAASLIPMDGGGRVITRLWGASLDALHLWQRRIAPKAAGSTLSEGNAHEGTGQTPERCTPLPTGLIAALEGLVIGLREEPLVRLFQKDPDSPLGMNAATINQLAGANVIERVIRDDNGFKAFWTIVHSPDPLKRVEWLVRHAAVGDERATKGLNEHKLNRTIQYLEAWLHAPANPKVESRQLPLPPDPFADLRQFAREELRGQQRAVVLALCDAKGELLIADLALKEDVGWEDPIDGFKGVQRNLNPKLKKRKPSRWRLERHNNAARLRQM